MVYKKNKLRKQRVLSLIPYVFFLVIVIFLFYKYFFYGLIPIPADIITGMYFPWLDYKWGNEVGVAVRNPLISDTVSQIWIWRNWAVSAFKDGKSFFWNPYSLAGYPMAPLFHTMIFSFANIFYFLTDKLNAMSMIVISQLLFMLISSYIYLKNLLNNVIASVFTAVSLSFSAYFIGWLTYGVFGWTIWPLPLILYGIDKYLTTGRKRFLIFITFLNLISLLGGHPQTYLFVIIISFIYLVFKTYKTNLKKFKSILISLFFSPLIASFTLLPSFQVAFYSIRNYETYLKEVNYGFIPPLKAIILMLSPNFFGNPASNNYWGEGFNYQEYFVWFGSIALFFAILSFSFYRRYLFKFKRSYLAFVSVFILGLLLSFEYPVGFLIYKFNLPLISTGSASRSLFLTAFSGSILAGFTLKTLLENNHKFKTIIKCLFPWMIYLIFFGASVKYILGSNIGISPQNIEVAQRNLVLPFISVLSGILLTIALTININNLLKKKTLFSLNISQFYKNTIGIIFITLISLEGLYFAFRQIPFAKKEYYFPSTPTIEYIDKQYQESQEIFRIESLNEQLMPSNMWMAYKFYSASGYDPAYPKSFGDYLIKHNEREIYSRYYNSRNNLELSNDLGVKYFLVLKEKNGKIDKEGEIPKLIREKNWVKVFEDKTTVVMQNIDYAPIYLLQDDGQNTINGKVDLIAHSDNSWQFNIYSPEKAVFILKENNFPGWTATVNNSPVEIKNYDETFKSINIPQGTSIIKMEYKNYMFTIGLIISVLSGFLYILFLSRLSND